MTSARSHSHILKPHPSVVASEIESGRVCLVNTQLVHIFDQVVPDVCFTMTHMFQVCSNFLKPENLSWVLVQMKLQGECEHSVDYAMLGAQGT